MKQKNKKIIIGISAGILILIISGIVYFLLSDKNKLTIMERNWINKNINNVQNINVINDANVFGKDGKGVYYSFLSNFSNDYKLEINPITYIGEGNPSGITFGLKKDISKNDIVMYKDHYVLVGKHNETIFDVKELESKRVGILNSDLDILVKYLGDANHLTFIQYDNIDNLKNGFAEEVDYIIVPLIDNLDYILDGKNIIYHFSDVNIYYVISLDDSVLSKIIRKYYNKWQNLSLYFNQETFSIFVDSLHITDPDIDTLKSVEYNYGFVNNSPYEIIKGGKYGGVVAIYLSEFGDFADVDININKYKNQSKFNKAIKSKDIDIFFNYYALNNNYYKTKGIPISYSIITNMSNDIVINSIYSLKDKTVYVEKDSLIYNYVKDIPGLIIKTYDNEKELFKLNKKDEIIILDRNSFSYYSKEQLSNYIEKYSDNINAEYSFNVKENNTLYKLLNKYMEVKDGKKAINQGISNHNDVVKSGIVVNNVMEYITILLLICAIVSLFVIRKGKKVCIAKRIKKDDKLKYIDQLTSLKNRNFLNENIAVWGNNTIYPQAIIVIDLNKVQEINDVYGYNEGDNQIKAAANILVKTQLDNSEVMRTDGNEFVVYLMGYSQKQYL